MYAVALLNLKAAVAVKRILGKSSLQVKLFCFFVLVVVFLVGCSLAFTESKK